MQAGEQGVERLHQGRHLPRHRLLTQRRQVVGRALLHLTRKRSKWQQPGIHAEPDQHRQHRQSDRQGVQEMADHALRQFIAQGKTFTDLHHTAATVIPAAENSPTLTVNGGVEEPVILFTQTRLGCVGRAQPQDRSAVPHLKGDIGRLFVLAWHGLCGIVVYFVLYLRSNQTRRLDQMRIKHPPKLLPGIEIRE